MSAPGRACHPRVALLHTGKLLGGALPCGALMSGPRCAWRWPGITSTSSSMQTQVSELGERAHACHALQGRDACSWMPGCWYRLPGPRLPGSCLAWAESSAPLTCRGAPLLPDQPAAAAEGCCCWGATISPSSGRQLHLQAAAAGAAPGGHAAPHAATCVLLSLCMWGFASLFCTAAPAVQAPQLKLHLQGPRAAPCSLDP